MTSSGPLKCAIAGFLCDYEQGVRRSIESMEHGLIVLLVVLPIKGYTMPRKECYVVGGTPCPLVSFLDMSYSVSFVVRGQRPRRGQFGIFHWI